MAMIVVVVLAFLVVVATGQNEGMVIWPDGDDEEASLEYSLWDGNSFSSSHEMGGIKGNWKLVRGASSPIRDEAIVVAVRDDVAIAKLYSGGQWSDLLSSPQYYDSTVGNFLESMVNDVQYESQSGNPLIIWKGGSMTRYAKWTGSRWSLGIITKPFQINRFKLVPSPKSNEMVFIISESRGRAYAIVWDGDSWGDGLVLEKVLENPEGVNAAVAFEQKRGRAIVAYQDGSPSLKYQIWDGVTWSGERSISPPVPLQNAIFRFTISADPSTNRVVAAVQPKQRLGFWVTVWNGNNHWGSKTFVVSSLLSPAKILDAAAAFEGTSQRAIVAYSQAGNEELKYLTWSSSSGWSELKRGPKLIGRQPNGVMLYTHNESNDVMLAIHNTDWEPYFCKWSGAGWGKVKRLTNKPARVGDKQFPFLWKPVVAATQVPTAFPTRHSTPPPTHFPTPTPSTKPTLQPTDMPTPPPTSSPTPVPTAHPSHSTPPPTHFPTPAPSIKPTLQPTDMPTPPPISSPTSVPDQSRSHRKSENHQEDSVAIGTVTTGHPCNNNEQCESNTCRDGVCMATAACYPLKHKFGEPFFEHKVNIVFVASGFDTATIDEWHTHVNRTYKSFEDYKVFSNEIEQLNMFRVDPYKLDSSYCGLNCLGLARLLCCHQHRALTLAQMCVPVGSNLQTVVIHNDMEYGGAGYVDANIATATTHPRAPEIAAHELGHSLFDLVDEYSYGSGTDESPNCASDSNCDKWSDLIGNTPAGYDPVRCLPGCRNENYFVGTLSFMNDLDSPVGAVNDRFACCTYFALTKSFPSFCEPFNKTQDYLLNYCVTNDYQGYGRASYEREPLLFISDGAVQDSNTKYVQVPHPRMVLITTKKRRSGATVCRAKHVPLDPGMFLRSHVEGDFSSPRMAKKEGCDSLFKVMVFYQTRKETLFYCRNTAIEVPISQDPTDDDEPLVAFEQVDSRNIVLDTKGARVKKVAVKCIDLS